MGCTLGHARRINKFPAQGCTISVWSFFFFFFLTRPVWLLFKTCWRVNAQSVVDKCNLLLVIKKIEIIKVMLIDARVHLVIDYFKKKNWYYFHEKY